MPPKTNLHLQPLFRKPVILAGIKKLAKKLNAVYKNSAQPVILIGILKGCLPFMLELVKHLKFDLVMDFLIISSYFGKTKPAKTPKLILDVDINLVNSDVLIIEDIVESGKTISFAIKHLAQKNPKTIKVASLLYKKIAKTLVKPDYYVFDVPTKNFLVGFGLDYHEQKRNLTYIGILNVEK